MCGSARTEEVYLRGLRDAAANRAVDVTVVNRPKDPLKVVRSAVELAERGRRDFDQVWCVFDVDDFDIASAVRAAKQQGVELAVSNPCFELWLLLHHEACNGHCRGCGAVMPKLKKHVKGYDKSRPRFADFSAGVVDACDRARALDPTGNAFGANPSSSVWRLVETIVEAS